MFVAHGRAKHEATRGKSVKSGLRGSRSIAIADLQRTNVGGRARVRARYWAVDEAVGLRRRSWRALLSS